MGKRSQARRQAKKVRTPAAEPQRVTTQKPRQIQTIEGKWTGGDSIPDVSDVECAFPTRWRDLLPPREDLNDDERQMRGPFCDAVLGIFHRGGKLSDHGISVMPGYDETKVIRYIHATLGDFGPSHEHKIGGIAHALAKWCTISPAKRR